MELSSKAAYLKGLFEGMALDYEKNEIKVLGSIIELLQNMSNEIDVLKADCSDNKELIYELDEDLGEIERLVCKCGKAKSHDLFDEKEDDHDCGSCRKEEFYDGDFSNYEESDEYLDNKNRSCKDENCDEECYEILCPHCQHVISLHGCGFKNDEIVCPNCGKKLNFDFSSEN